MTSVGVVSDTHFVDLRDGLNFFAGLVETVFADVEFILHAGDIVCPDLATCFDMRPLLAVRGNCDHDMPELPVRRIIECAGYRIGLTHGWGDLYDLELRLCDDFATDEIDCLVYGHSHYPICRWHNGVLLMNPGSPTDRRRAPHHTVGILRLGDQISGEIINVDHFC